ncbi:MAG: hypothetical protein PXZ07_02345 [Candidatus Eremiobacteraeota bacterium]|nr:hypothetical protein [Candidatus Eremiobacteraeota bacterium]
MPPIDIVGILAALALAIAAFAASRRNEGHPYADEVYAMTPRSHRRYAALGLLFASAIAAALALHLPTMPLLAILTLVIVFYATSFLRGFSDV